MVTPASTLLRLEGRDALDLLHRISTQHLRELAPGECRTTLFCDFRGRVQHRAVVARASDGSVWLLRPDAPGADLFTAIDRQIFRDRVSIEDLSTRAAVIAIAAAPGGKAGTVDDLDGLPAVAHLAGGIAVLVGAAAGVTPLAEPARIRLGAPRHSHEIRDDFNPFEAGLAHDVHLDKGCFTGQEALLRMMTYGGVRRRLALLEGTGATPGEDTVVRRGDDDAGVITSAATDAGGWVALAIVKRDCVARDAALTTAEGTSVDRVTPFPDERPAGRPDPAAAP